MSSRIGNKFWSAATDIALDTGMQAWDIWAAGDDLKKDFDYQRLGQTFVRSLIMNAKYSCDPVDCARGNLFYYKKDISSDDLYGRWKKHIQNFLVKKIEKGYITMRHLLLTANSPSICQNIQNMMVIY
ncbi:hypothetical protein acsn021_30720 [Anaerocolumna cellulosilytica]|uniref:Uncharacterized protein n=1 Tax=Anaerocolumna cellulosilytica TaxID=433286 RepID=A0A6S6QWA4_9FIRM|nr:hypothetical protein [Anaerocolumna cellulosilytica]MBB5197484.1 hypothetical protein [Anaerocolumna cellulosilytica]BCJ95503.1 hypothetical protein acsn021_30720 [Anaerocolumna cellulosilytica]